MCFRIDILSGGDHLSKSSGSKKEAIKRGVYICDVKFQYDTAYLLFDTNKLHIYEGWMEKSWCSGYFFWTTLPGEGYEIRLKSKSNINNKKNWILMNRKYNTFLNFYNGLFHCWLNTEPQSDTIIFNLYKKYYINYPDSNKAGSINLVLQR
jgi:hypothetical protein